MSTAREPAAPRISVVCVYNNEHVLRECLEASVGGHEDVELIAVDNTAHAFTSAGAALNHGASLATHDYVVLAHQDVYVHSVAALRRAAGLMASDPRWGILGAVGADADGRLVGRIRDRLIMTAERVTEPVVVDSLDEVLFIVPRASLERDPLITDPELAWHAYAVEYGLRVSARGLLVGVADMPLTHNSLTINLAKLDVAHQAIAARYPGRLPVQTTCGRVPGQLVHTTRHPVVARARRTARRSIEWLRVARALRSVRVAPTLVDVRRHIDTLVRRHDGARMTVVNVVSAAEDPWEPVTLSRHGAAFDFEALAVGPALREARRAASEGSFVVVTDLDGDSLAMAVASLPGADVGYSLEAGFWVAVPPVRS